MNLNPQKRFRILQRDNFTCQYCGAKAPNTTLQVDHIIAKSKGGANDDSNLVTACFDCNLGKKADSINVDKFSEKNLSTENTAYNFRKIPIEKMVFLLDWASKLKPKLSDGRACILASTARIHGAKKNSDGKWCVPKNSIDPRMGVGAPKKKPIQ